MLKSTTQKPKGYSKSSANSLEKSRDKSRRSSFVQNLINEYKYQSKKKNNKNIDAIKKNILNETFVNKTKYVTDKQINYGGQLNHQKQVNFNAEADYKQIKFPLKESHQNYMQDFKNKILIENNVKKIRYISRKDGRQSKELHKQKNYSSRQTKQGNIQSKRKQQLLQTIQLNKNQLSKCQKISQFQSNSKNKLPCNKLQSIQSISMNKQKQSIMQIKLFEEKYKKEFQNLINLIITKKYQEGLNVLLEIKKQIGKIKKHNETKQQQGSKILTAFQQKNSLFTIQRIQFQVLSVYFFVIFLSKRRLNEAELDSLMQKLTLKYDKIKLCPNQQKNLPSSNYLSLSKIINFGFLLRALMEVKDDQMNAKQQIISKLILKKQQVENAVFEGIHILQYKSLFGNFIQLNKKSQRVFMRKLIKQSLNGVQNYFEQNYKSSINQSKKSKFDQESRQKRSKQKYRYQSQQDKQQIYLSQFLLKNAINSIINECFFENLAVKYEYTFDSLSNNKLLQSSEFLNFPQFLKSWQINTFKEKFQDIILAQIKFIDQGRQKNNTEVHKQNLVSIKIQYLERKIKYIQNNILNKMDKVNKNSDQCEGNNKGDNKQLIYEKNNDYMRDKSDKQSFIVSLDFCLEFIGIFSVYYQTLVSSAQKEWSLLKKVAILQSIASEIQERQINQNINQAQYKDSQQINAKSRLKNRNYQQKSKSFIFKGDQYQQNDKIVNSSEVNKLNFSNILLKELNTWNKLQLMTIYYQLGQIQDSLQIIQQNIFEIVLPLISLLSFSKQIDQKQQQQKSSDKNINKNNKNNNKKNKNKLQQQYKNIKYLYIIHKILSLSNQLNFIQIQKEYKFVDCNDQYIQQLKPQHKQPYILKLKQLIEAIIYLLYKIINKSLQNTKRKQSLDLLNTKIYYSNSQQSSPQNQTMQGYNRKCSSFQYLINYIYQDLLKIQLYQAEQSVQFATIENQEQAKIDKNQCKLKGVNDEIGITTKLSIISIKLAIQMVAIKQYQQKQEELMHQQERITTYRHQQPLSYNQSNFPQAYPSNRQSRNQYDNYNDFLFINSKDLLQKLKSNHQIQPNYENRFLNYQRNYKINADYEQYYNKISDQDNQSLYSIKFQVFQQVNQKNKSLKRTPFYEPRRKHSSQLPSSNPSCNHSVTLNDMSNINSIINQLKKIPLQYLINFINSNLSKILLENKQFQSQNQMIYQRINKLCTNLSQQFEIWRQLSN